MWLIIALCPEADIIMAENEHSLPVLFHKQLKMNAFLFLYRFCSIHTR